MLCINLVKYWDKYTEMQHDQQNVKNIRMFNDNTRKLVRMDSCSCTLLSASRLQGGVTVPKDHAVETCGVSESESTHS